jgi:hypothetical protein
MIAESVSRMRLRVLQLIRRGWGGINEIGLEARTAVVPTRLAFIRKLVQHRQ